MRWIALGWLGLLSALSGNAFGADVWKPVAAVTDVAVRLHWVTEAELRAAARSLGKWVTGEALAFSVLRLNPATGAYTCDIYMPNRPSRVQDRATASLGHEMAHCLGFSHEES